MATCGIAAGAGETIVAINKEIERQKLKQVKVVPVGCIGYCHAEPLVQVNIPGQSPVLYGNVKVEQGRELVIALAEKRTPNVTTVEMDFARVLGEEADVKSSKKQYRIALRNCGLINPDSIDEYIACRGYEALSKVLTEMSPEAVIETVKASGLRGRGGGGFSTGLKWELTRKTPTDGVKYIFCNADEGDPGAFMDRSILEGDPHSVIEAMAIGGYAIGAEIGIIYIRAEYPLAIKRLKAAIADATKYGFLGEKILGSNFNFKIELRLGAGAFVCGEETALINSAEGRRGEPRNKPPYPAERGYWGQPTCVNNVETFANIAPIILNGASWFSQIGTERSKGTKVFALAGKVRNEGLIEVPMGTTLRQIIYNIGGGIKDDRRFKAVQTGGPSGGVITEDYLDTVIDYETLKSIDSIMGSGGMIVMDETDCMVNIAKFYLEFTQDESCGKCTPCRIGNKRLYELLEKITNGSAEMEDIDKIERLAKMIKDASICGLGQTAPNPVLSTLKFFKNEYLEHIQSKYCATGSCTGLNKFKIDPKVCIGCTACVKVCPVKCISGQPGKPHQIDEQKCIKCGACRKVCKFGAVIKP
ncbi:MAG TPA: NADH-quinone oxidoreductase subunit NuoF [Bacillota bacterium]|nr:NADH-quinone oxidoreductase subunit NuoF [Bacillota bacterium]HOL09575.1 NADH-quinone oxidoreductase subunit NuoF [Bacillota bacterium]HPO97264.1 NADH-quinone oxidoreductase subunit NuoF [Bacillota bacterium]